MTIKTTTLANGLRVISDPMPQLQTAAVGVWVDTGSRHERLDQNGISHVLEHMAFKGTKTRTALEIAETIEAVGGHLNAYTSRDQTAYFARILKQDVGLAIDILSDILQFSTFEELELQREKEVIVQEIGQTIDTPDDIIFDHLQETAFPDQPMGRSILGTAERVRGFERKNISDYMQDRYLASKLVLSASGAIDHEQLVNLAEQAFGSLNKGDAVAPDRARYQGGDYREIRDLEQVHLALSVPGVAYEDSDFYPLQILSSLLGGGMASRLFQELREKRGLCYSVFSFSSSFADSGLFSVYAGTSEHQVGELTSVMIDELRHVSIDVRAEEILRAAAQHKAGLLMGMESPASRCEAHARQMLIYGRVLTLEEIVEKIEKVDAAAVMAAADRLFSKVVPSIAAMGPVKRLESYDKLAARFH